jgi:hypothetical protein
MAVLEMTERRSGLMIAVIAFLYLLLSLVIYLAVVVSASIKDVGIINGKDISHLKILELK